MSFVASLANGRSCLSFDSDGEARLTLVIPEQEAAKVAAALPRLRDRALGVAIQPVQG